MRALLAIACIAATAATGVSASDINFGATARSAAMGGAGIALGDDSGTTTMLNPAAPACAGARFRFIFPGVDFHTSGASFGDLADSLNKIGGGTDDALSLINDFAKQPTSLSLNTITGFSGPMGFTLEAEANGTITPSPEAQKWASAAQQFSDIQNLNLSSLQQTINNTNFSNAIAYATDSDPATDPDAAFDAYLNELNQTYIDANVVYGPGFLLGKGLDTANGRLWMGTNLKVLVTQGKTWQIVGARSGSLNVSNGNVLTDVNFSAVELNGDGRTTTMKADVGLIYRPNNSVLQYGVVANNFIKPRIKGLTNTQDDLILSGGIAAVVGRNLTLAADLVNLTSANGEKPSLRAGGEIRLGRLFAARAGYSGSEWTTGFELLGLNISWAGRSAQLLSNVLKF